MSAAIIIRTAVTLLTGLSIVALGAWPARLAAQTGDGAAQIIVYVEVPTVAAANIDLTLRAVTLVGDGGRLDLRPERERLASNEIRGQQLRLLEASIPSGMYRGLEIDFELAGDSAAPVPPATTQADTVLVPLRRQIGAGTSQLVALRWVPRAPDPGSAALGQEITRLEPDVPPPGSLAFVTNRGSGNLSVVDRNAGRVVDVVWTGGAPRGIVYSRLRQWLYVAVAETSEIVIIDARTRNPVRRVPQRYGDEPSRLLLADDEQTLFVLNQGSNVVAVFAADNLHELRRLAVGERPRSFALDRRSGQLFVTSELTGEIRVYDALQGSEVRTIVTDSSPTELVIDGTASSLFLSSSARRRLLVLDPRSGAQTGQLNLCAPATGLALNPVSGRLYAATGECEEISVSLPARGLDVSSIRLPGRPGLLAFDSDYRQLMVTLPDAGRLAIVNSNSGRVVQVVETGRLPYAVVVP